MRKELLTLPDDDLIDRYKSGCNQAFETLFYRHKQRIHAQIICLIKDRFIADDIFQEVFIKIASILKNNIYNPNGRFLKWLLVVTHNCCMDFYRKQKSSKWQFYSSTVEKYETRDLCCSFEAQHLEITQQHRILNNLINKLPEKQREIFILRHFAEMPFKEIAKVVDCPLNTSLGCMRYALNNMRRTIKENNITL